MLRLWFGLAYVVRYVLSMLSAEGGPLQSETGSATNPNSGALLDMTTPDKEDVLRNLLRPNEAEAKQENPAGDNGGSFQSLQPPKLVTKLQPDAEQLAQAVRHFVQK